MAITTCPSRLRCNFQSLITYIHSFISVCGISMCNVHMCTYVYRYMCMYACGNQVNESLLVSLPTLSPFSIYFFSVCRGGNWGHMYAAAAHRRTKDAGEVHSLFPPCEPLPVSRHVFPLCYEAGQSAPLQDPGHDVLPHHGLKTMVPSDHRLLKLSQNKSFLL